MPEHFDPYRKWLGIPPQDQPPNHYRLLGIAHFEDDPDVIENAASRQMSHVRTFQGGKHSADSQRILNELTSAKLCLLQPEKKSVYDAALRQQLGIPMDAPVEESASDYPPPPPDDFRPGKRWRTGTDIEVPLPSVGPAPVPIPMPPTAPPPIGLDVAMPGPVVRRGTSSVSRGRKSNSGVPIFLILGAIGLLAVAIVVAVMMTMQPPANSNQAKQKSTGSEKTPDKPGSKNNVANSSFPVGSNPKPNRSPRPEPVNNKSLNPSPPAALSDPADELKLARTALARRNDGDFKLHISQAEYLIGQKKPTNAAELEADKTHLAELDKHLSKFWQAVRDGADKKIPKGERFKFRKHEVEIVNREGEQLKYKFNGREELTAIKKLPAQVATAIAYRAMGNGDLSGKIVLTLFLTIDADAASEPGNRRLALKLLDDIHKAGEENNPVLTRELGKATPPVLLPEDDFAPPTVIGASTPAASPPMPTVSTPSTPAPAPAKASFDSQRLKEARERFEKRFRERMVIVAEQLTLAKPLMTELIEAAEGSDETPEFKAHVLNQANELAARIGDSNTIAKISQQISQLTNESPVEIQLRLYSRCNTDGPTAAKDLIKNAQAASSQAEKDKNLYAAMELLKIAQRAAEKASLTSELSALQEKLQALQAQSNK